MFARTHSVLRTTCYDALNMGALADLLRAAAARGGHLAIRVNAGDLIVEDALSLRGDVLARELVEQYFETCALVTHRLAAVRSMPAGLALHVTSDTAGHEVALNLAALMCLPGVDAPAELLSVAQWCDWVAQQMRAWPQARCAVVMSQRCVAQAPARRLVGDCGFELTGLGTLEQSRAQAEVLSQALRYQIEGNPTLSHLLREVAASLGRLETGAMLRLTEELFFGLGRGPHQAWWQSRRAGSLGVLGGTAGRPD